MAPELGEGNKLVPKGLGGKGPAHPVVIPVTNMVGVRVKEATVFVRYGPDAT